MFSSYYDRNNETNITNKPDELDSYLTSNIVLDDYKINNEHGIEFDLLKFWKVHQEKCSKLAMLARFIFSIPASTVASESNFSKVVGPSTTVEHSWTPKL